jgi:hypothetical protein
VISEIARQLPAPPPPPNPEKVRRLKKQNKAGYSLGAAVRIATELGWRPALAKEWNCEWPLQISTTERKILCQQFSLDFSPYEAPPSVDWVLRLVLGHRIRPLLQEKMCTDAAGIILQLLSLE